MVHTPLVDYLNKRIEERARIRDERREERRKRELERKQKREDDRSKRVAAIEKGKKTSREQEKWDEWEDDYEESGYYVSVLLHISSFTFLLFICRGANTLGGNKAEAKPRKMLHLLPNVLKFFSKQGITVTL